MPMFLLIKYEIKTQFLQLLKVVEQIFENYGSFRIKRGNSQLNQHFLNLSFWKYFPIINISESKRICVVGSQIVIQRKVLRVLVI